MESVKLLEGLISEGKLPEALDFIEALPQEERQQWQIQNLTGVVCSYCGQFKEAATFFEAALEQRPDDAEILYNLAETYAALGMERPAKNMLERCQRYAQAESLLEDIASLRQRLAEQKGGRVLMAAYYFPPLSGSGVFRSIKFAKYLPLYGWEPTVISTDRPPNGWNFADESMVGEIPEGMEVIRIPDGISTGRETHLGSDRVQGILDFLRSVLRYSPDADRIFFRLSQSKEGIMELLTFPCAALSWAHDTVQYIEKNVDLNQFQAVYTTSGPSSAHLIGFYLKQKYGIPWVADYRDPWTFNPYGADYNPENPSQRLLFELESVLLRQADRSITVEESLVQTYEKEFGLPAGKVVGISNGYDEADFAGLSRRPIEKTPKFTINYSGLLYTQQRSITPVLKAIQQLRDEKKIDLAKVQFRIVGVAEQGNLEAAKQYGLEEIICHTGYLSHSQALQANVNADLLLLLVGDEAKFKPVYTGKIFEYLRSGRPILALAPKDGAVDRVLRESGHGEAFLSTQIPRIKAMILREYKKWVNGAAPELLHSPVIERFERKVLTEQLADVLSTAVEQHNALLNPDRGPRYLVISNGGYPSEGDPRCMFVHQRVLKYIEAGLNVEVFGIFQDAPFKKYEYQGVQVMQGGVIELECVLRQNHYEKLLIHFVANGIIFAIQNAGKLDMPMIIWCHGYEALKWNAYFNNYTNEEIINNKQQWERNDAEKAQMMSQIFAMDNIQYIFVSDWMKRNVKKCVGLEPLHYEIIPNFIDCDFYCSGSKQAQDRLKILSIKSQTSRKYSSDLTAKAILELSNRNFFSNLEFDLYGEGVLFQENFGELLKRNFPNVHIHQKYLDQKQMKELYSNHGVFLSPTRLDSQGVSACEAMSAGLAVISCNTSAIPEFIDEECGSLYEFDNYFQLADEIEYLYYHPEEFLQKSQNAVKRVRKQCGYDSTIKRELALIKGSPQEYAVKEKTIDDKDAQWLKFKRWRDPNESFSSKEYWEQRYARGGTSGAGSYNRLAAFKAEVINDFIEKHQIRSIIEWGCGDGNQLGLFLPVPYTGYDVSQTAIKLCQKKYPVGDKQFVWYDGSRQMVEKRDLAMSLDVIYHLIEDRVFEAYMDNLFSSSAKYICIYSSDFDIDFGAHQKNRNFTQYVKLHFPEWQQIAFIKNRYPFDEHDPDNTSLADFYFYKRK